MEETLSNPARRLPLVAGTAALGVLSIHLDGAPCRVGCEFCYLGARDDSTTPPPRMSDAELERLGEALGRHDYQEIAVAVSEPARRALAPLRAIVAAASRRGKPVAITTTPAVLREEPSLVQGVARVSLSVDPRKGGPDAISRATMLSRRAVDTV